MSILLFADNDSAMQWLAPLAGAAALENAILLRAGASPLADTLATVLPAITVVDIGSPRFARLNFDAIALLIVDLPQAQLESSGGRRLMDALGKLAAESLALAFVGNAASVVGGALLDGVRAGLSLVPSTAVIPDLRGVGDLRTLLTALSARGLRLLALDAPVALRYNSAADRVQVMGTGSVLLAAFRSASADEPPVARLHVLTDGMDSAWPD